MKIFEHPNDVLVIDVVIVTYEPIIGEQARRIFYLIEGRVSGDGVIAAGETALHIR
jgi:hypothetical protein